MCSRLLAFLIGSAALSCAAEEFHTFTNGQGVSIKAAVVRLNGANVVIRREDGREFDVAVGSFSAADQTYIRQVTAAAPVPAPAVAATPAGAPGPNDKLEPAVINEAAGMAIFGDGALWASAADEVAARLKLRPESRTKGQSSFRAYPAAEARLFGARPFSVALYAYDNKAAGLSVVFANKGDLFGSKGSAELHFDKDTPPAEAEKIVKKAMDADITAIAATLTKVLGEPRKERFGEGKAGRMNMQRWDWRGHAILLAEAEGEYVGLQVVTTAFADAGGKVARLSDADARAQALANIEKREGGDVVITDIPMVDQGPKGYCVPATAERAMRYLGVPADMYVLANAGGTGYGGGTSVNELLQGIGRLIRAKGRSFDAWDGEMKLRDLAKYIDKGVPVIWGLYSTDGFNKTANARTKDRKNVTDWAAWAKKVADESAQAALAPDRDKGHVVLIIGYNKDTGEIAFSDSWGERYMERWITMKEAQMVSQNAFYVIGF